MIVERTPVEQSAAEQIVDEAVLLALGPTADGEEQELEEGGLHADMQRQDCRGMVMAALATLERAVALSTVVPPEATDRLRSQDVEAELSAPLGSSDAAEQATHRAPQQRSRR